VIGGQKYASLARHARYAMAGSDGMSKIFFEPLERVAYTYTGHGLKLVETNRIAVTDSPVFIDLRTIFADEE
jgi:hypothetical protein